MASELARRKSRSARRDNRHALRDERAREDKTQSHDKQPVFWNDSVYPRSDARNRFIMSAIIFAIGIGVMIRYGTCPECPFVLQVNGTYAASAVRQSDRGYFMEYRFNISKYNSTNCFYTATPRFETAQQAWQETDHIKYMNLTDFLFDTWLHQCYDMSISKYATIMCIIILITVSAGMCAIKASYDLRGIQRPWFDDD